MKLWNASVAAIQSIDRAPDWLKEQARLSFEEAMRLSALDVAADGSNARPSIDERLVKSDYLDFLREQIKLEPRGPEWGAILKARLAALEPFVDKSLIRAMFYRKPDLITLQINPETGLVILIECD